MTTVRSDGAEMHDQIFRLSPLIDPNRLRAEFQRIGRVRITDFLTTPTANDLARHLDQRQDWRMIVNSGEKVFEIDRSAADTMGPERLEALDKAVHEAAHQGFQFRYRAIRVPDGEEERRNSETLLDAFALFLSSPAVVHLISTITGNVAIDFADSQATRYEPGDFLTGHDDAVAGKNRHAAYVFGLTPGWRTEWGGLLMFHEAGGRLAGLTPAFNTLDLFRVPLLHSVSYVAPFAGIARTSVTGWFRSNRA